MTMTYRYLRRPPKKAVELATAEYPYTFSMAGLGLNVLAVVGSAPGETTTPAATQRGHYISTMMVSPAGDSIAWTGISNVRGLAIYRRTPTPQGYITTQPVGLICEVAPDQASLFVATYSVSPNATSQAGMNSQTYENQVFQASPNLTTGQLGGGYQQIYNIGGSIAHASAFSTNQAQPRYNVRRTTINTPIGQSQYYTGSASYISGMMNQYSTLYSGNNVTHLEMISNTSEALAAPLLSATTNGSGVRWDIWVNDTGQPYANKTAPNYANVAGLPTGITNISQCIVEFRNNFLIIATHTSITSYSYNGAGAFTQVSTMPVSASGQIRMMRLSGNRILVASRSATGSYVRYNPSTGVFSSAGDQAQFPPVVWADVHTSGNVIAVTAVTNPTVFKIFSLTE